MKISSKLTLGELAALIASELKKSNIDCVLTGGAVVSIYTDNKYQSADLDYISPNDHKEIEKAVKVLGFNKEGRIFTHPDIDFYIEFPKGPLAIGNKIVRAEGELVIAGNKLTHLPCVRSRKRQISSSIGRSGRSGEFHRARSIGRSIK